MSGEGDLPRVRIGKYINPKLFVTFAQDIDSFRGQEVTVEYELLPQLTLEAQQVTGSDQLDTRQSVGLFWKKEW